MAAAVLLVLLLTADLLTTGADHLSLRSTTTAFYTGPSGAPAAAEATNTPAAPKLAAIDTPAAAIAGAPMAPQGTAMPAAPEATSIPGPPEQTPAAAAAPAPASLANQHLSPPATAAAASGGAAAASGAVDRSVLGRPDTAEPAAGSSAAVDRARTFGAEAAPAPAPRTGLQFLPWEIALGLLALIAGVAGFTGRAR